MREARRAYYIVVAMALGILCSACGVTRKLPQNEYLLQRVKIESDKQAPKEERITATTLEEYVRQTPNKRFLGTNFYVWSYNLANPAKDNWWNNLKRKIGEEPVLLNDALTEKSAQNLKTYMDSRGYYSSTVEYSVDTTRRRKRAYVTYRTTQNEPYRIKSIAYDFRDTQLAPVIEADSAASLLKVGGIFDITALDKERQRIASYLNNRGYYNFSINNIEYRVDTLGGNREASIRVIVKRNITGYDERGRAIMDNNRVFRITEIEVMPEYDPSAERESMRRKMVDTTYYQGLNIITEGRPNVRPAVLRSTIPLTPNTLYNASQLERTYSEIMSLGYFKSARITFEELPRGVTDSLTVNYAGEGRTAYSPRRFDEIKEGYMRCQILCSPTLKQGFNVELEGSTTSSFYGASATVGYQNRNLFRGAETFNASVTFGYEYMKAPNTSKRNANELGAAVGLEFPRFILPFRVSTRKINMPRTRVDVSFNYQDRPYYRRDLSRATWTYSWRSLNGRYSYQVRPIDINWINVGYMDNDFFNSLKNEYLRQSYRSQAIVGLSGSYTYNNQNKNIGGNATLLRINFESAGNLLNLVGAALANKTSEGYYNLLGVRYSQYVRGDVSLSRKIVLGEKSAVAGRIFAGCGVPYNNSSALPFDRLFYVGGSNSMRGWSPRTLGPGNTPAEDTPYPVQMGDMRLEGNVEFRFPVWGMFHGATFVDVGNVWYLGRDKSQVPADGVFHFDKFYKQLGFNSGLGLRIDITFVILRLDWGIQLHNPNRPEGQRWIHDFRWKNTALNFGVGYPF
ncbi:MAG: BamA/TamA family outer membrane protein [Alistipes sp.]|nr:BamA/TamA family outer membrane protein [Alistipes sp.]